MEVFKDFRFEAAHWLPNVPEDHQCHRLHGHSYRIRVRVNGEIGFASGWVIDYAEISAVVRPIIASLDHTCLNDTQGLENSTAEHLAMFIWRRIGANIAGLSAVEVYETPDAGVVYCGQSK